MIKKDNKTISSVYSGEKVIEKIFKGTLKVYEGWRNLPASGVPPLTLMNCKGVDLVDYKLYGNSVQDGTPTPETPIEIESVGEYDETTGKYKIPVRTRGKNLLNIETSEKLWISSSTGETGKSSVTYTSEYIKVKANTKYIFSYDYSTLSSTSTRVYCLYDKDKNFLRGTSYSPTSKQTIINVSKDGYLRFSYDINGFDIQIEEGDAVTSYEPYIEPITTNIYLNEPLRKVRKYTDYIDFLNKKVVRNVKRITLTGDETWSISDTNTATERLMYKLGDAVPSVQGFCNICLVNANAWDMTTFIGQVDSSGNIRFYRPFYTGLLTTGASRNNWKAYLKERYNSGNPVKIDYALATPVEETIDLPNIPTIKGTTILEVDTTIQPSNLEVVYKGKEVK